MRLVFLYYDVCILIRISRVPIRKRVRFITILRDTMYKRVAEFKLSVCTMYRKFWRVLVVFSMLSYNLSVVTCVCNNLILKIRKKRQFFFLSYSQQDSNLISWPHLSLLYIIVTLTCCHWNKYLNIMIYKGQKEEIVSCFIIYLVDFESAISNNSSRHLKSVSEIYPPVIGEKKSREHLLAAFY